MSGAPRPVLAPCTFQITRQVQFAETDLAGVMHFSNYFRLLEEVEHAGWRSLGRSVVASGAAEVLSWPRVRVACEYFGPAHFEDALDLRLTLLRIGSKSLEFAVEFRRGEETLARATATVVCCRMHPGGSFESLEVPPDVRAQLQPLVRGAI